jgi:hypothetical protein
MGFDSSIATAREQFGWAAESIESAYQDSDLATGEQVTPPQLVEAVGQFLAILDRNPPDAPTGSMQEAGEPDRIGNYVLSFLQDLVVYAERLGQEDAQAQLQQVAVAVALWLAAYQAPIRSLDLSVNALSQQANQTADPAELRRLGEMMDQLIAHAGPEEASDLEAGNPQRPWRILLMNRAIVAVRSNDADAVRRAFDLLRQRLPQDATAFFPEAERQVASGDYSEAVTEVVREFARGEA